MNLKREIQSRFMIVIEGRNKNLGKRFYANFFDYLIVFILYGVYIFTVGDQDDSGTYRVTGFKALFLPLVWILYFPLCESILGQTIGKKAFNLHIVDLHGEKPTIVHAFIRRMLDVFEMMLFGVPALLAINYSPKNQRIGDMIAGTTVIQTDAVCRLCGTDLELTPKEVMREAFKCPHCNEMN